MLHLFLLPAFALAAPAADPLYSLGVGVAHTHVQPVTSCQTVSEVALQQSCHVEHSQVCPQTSTSVFPSTSVVGTASSLHLVKREAEAEAEADADADAHIGISGYVVSSPAVATVAVATPAIAT